jgi:hypothetical protein
VPSLGSRMAAALGGALFGGFAIALWFGGTRAPSRRPM